MQNTHLITDPKLTYEANHKYLGIFGMLWVTFLLIATFTALKTFTIFGLEYTVAIIAYPMTYIFADIFTEVYGYKVTRKIVWTGFVCLIIASILSYFYSVIPPSVNFVDNDAFKIVFMATPALAFATLLSFFSGELVNSFTLAKLKIATKGKMPEVRYVISTFFGQITDNTIFFVGVYLLAGIFTANALFSLVFSSVLFCTLVEMCMIPVTRNIIRYIKHKEGLDTFDIGTNFNPFSLK